MREPCADDSGWSFDPPSAVYRYGTACLTIGPDRIRVVLSPDADERIGTLLCLGPGVAGVLANRVPVLHGTTLRTEDGDGLLIGPSGVGKSSLTAAFLQAGATLVADDIAALDGTTVRPGIPRIKLWRDAVEAFGWDPATFARVHPDFDKFSVPTPCVRESRALSWIAILDRGEGVRRLTPREALPLLLANHRLPEILTPTSQVRWLHAMSEIARELPVWRVCLPGPHDALPGIVGSAEGWG